MSTFNSTKWTCDRCGAKTEISNTEKRPCDQPIRWCALYEIDPPLMDPNESDRRPDQICGDCRDSFHDWFIAGHAA